MKFRPQVLFTLVVLIFFIVFVYQAKEWRLQARLYPWAIGFPMIAIAVLFIARELIGTGGKPQQAQPGSTPVDFQFTKGIDPKLARRRTITIFSWIFGFFFGIWLLGFALTVPLFVFFYLKVQSRESWPISIGLTAGAWVLFWALFDKLLKLPFPEGQIFTWFGPWLGMS